MSIFRRRLLIAAIKQTVSKYIKFADSVVASICKTAYSSDGIGVTTADAAAVTTSFLGNFKSNASITSFNEAVYFTGIGTAFDSTQGAFENCTALTEVTLPMQITEISVNTFHNDTALKAVYNGNNVTRLGSNCFYNCTGLTTFNTGNVTIYDAAALRNTYNHNLTLSNNISGFLSSYAFALDSSSYINSSLNDTVDVTGKFTGVTGIYEYCFFRNNKIYGALNLTSATVVRYNSFFGTRIRRLKFPKIKLENDSFSYCTELTDITGIENITGLWMDGGFQYCAKLDFLGYTAKNCTFSTFSRNSVCGMYNTYINCTFAGQYGHAYNQTGNHGVNVIIEGSSTTSSTTIGLSNNSNIRSITIKDKPYIKLIGFTTNTNAVLYDFDLADNCTLSNSTFTNCYALKDVIFRMNTPPTGTTSFGYTSDFNIWVPDNSINAYKAAVPFSSYTSRIFPLSTYTGTVYSDPEITFADSTVKNVCVSNWGFDSKFTMACAGNIASIGDIFKGMTGITSFNEFQYFTGLTSFSAAYYNTFYQSSITSIIFPQCSVTSIPSYCCSDCYNLSYVKVSEGYTYIGTVAFQKCSISLLELPSTLTGLGDSIMFNNTSNCSIKCLATVPPAMSSTSFGYTSKTVSIYVPDSSVNAYKTAWTYYKTRIFALSTYGG